MRKIIFATRLIFLSLTFVGLNAFAQSWQALVIFAGADMDAVYQADIDANIMELARLEFSQDFELQVVREFSDRIVYYNPTKSKKLHDWNPLFFKTPRANVKIPGELTISTHQGRVFEQTQDLKKLGQSFFKGRSHRMIIYYGHGEGAKGLRGLRASRVNEFLTQLAPARTNQLPVDILWMDSCYMGNLELAFELRNFTNFYVASQEAEFAAGSPLQNLDLIGGLHPAQAAEELATKFIESYSSLQSGSQSRYIESSSATVSVVATQELLKLSQDLKTDLKSLLVAQQTKPELWLRRSHEIRMEHSELVDLGGLLKWIPSRARERLELSKQKSYRIAPRVTVQGGGSAQSFVFAYNGWKRGYLGDNVVYPERLKPESYMTFKGGREFPVRRINKKLVISPFGIGLDQFDWLLLDSNKKPVGPAMAVRRQQDFFVRYASRPDNPIRFFATTHGTGNNSDKYSGLNVSNPLVPQFDMDYGNLEFVKSTGWGQ